VRILHTSDWHIGKRLGRHDRMSEHHAVLAEVERISEEREVDLVLVSGDLFDRPIPPTEALDLGLRTLVRLGRGRPVVAVAGNHDSPDLFETLAPLLAPHRVHLVGAIKRPDEGGILGPDDLGVGAAVACFPFLREGRVVDFMRDAGEWYGQYAERVAKLCRAYDEQVRRVAGRDAVPLLTAHFLVNGVKVGGGGAPRGERALHMGAAYTATEQAIPPGPQYVAMGHIHLPQRVPAAPVPAEYAGSLLCLDFGEAGEEKRVVLVDVEPGSLATIESVPIMAGRPLVRATGTWEELGARSDLDDAYLDLTVRMERHDPGLADRAHDRFDLLVKVRADVPRGEAGERRSRGGRDWHELFADYYADERGHDVPDEVATAFREVVDEVLHATP